MLLYKAFSRGCSLRWLLLNFMSCKLKTCFSTPMFTHTETFFIHLTHQHFGEILWFQYPKFYSHLNISHSFNTNFFVLMKIPPVRKNFPFDAVQYVVQGFCRVFV